MARIIEYFSTNMKIENINLLINVINANKREGILLIAIYKYY